MYPLFVFTIFIQYFFHQGSGLQCSGSSWECFPADWPDVCTPGEHCVVTGHNKGQCCSMGQGSAGMRHAENPNMCCLTDKQRGAGILDASSQCCTLPKPDGGEPEKKVETADHERHVVLDGPAPSDQDDNRPPGISPDQVHPGHLSERKHKENGQSQRKDFEAQPPNPYGYPDSNQPNSNVGNPFGFQQKQRPQTDEASSAFQNPYGTSNIGSGSNYPSGSGTQFPGLGNGQGFATGSNRGNGFGFGSRNGDQNLGVPNFSTGPYGSDGNGNGGVGSGSNYPSGSGTQFPGFSNGQGFGTGSNRGNGFGLGSRNGHQNLGAPNVSTGPYGSNGNGNGSGVFGRPAADTVKNGFGATPNVGGFQGYNNNNNGFETGFGSNAGGSRGSFGSRAPVISNPSGYKSFGGAATGTPAQGSGAGRSQGTGTSPYTREYKITKSANEEMNERIQTANYRSSRSYKRSESSSHRTFTQTRTVPTNGMQQPVWPPMG